MYGGDDSKPGIGEPISVRISAFVTVLDVGNLGGWARERESERGLTSPPRRAPAKRVVAMGPARQIVRLLLHPQLGHVDVHVLTVVLLCQADEEIVSALKRARAEFNGMNGGSGAIPPPDLFQLARRQPRIIGVRQQEDHVWL